MLVLTFHKNEFLLSYSVPISFAEEYYIQGNRPKDKILVIYITYLSALNVLR